MAFTEQELLACAVPLRPYPARNIPNLTLQALKLRMSGARIDDAQTDACWKRGLPMGNVNFTGQKVHIETVLALHIGPFNIGRTEHRWTRHERNN